MKKLIFLIIILNLSFVGAYSVFPRPVVNDEFFPNTFFVHNFTFSSDTNGVLLSNQSNISTDSSGIAYTSLDISSLSEVPDRMIYRRDGTIIFNKTFEDKIFNKVYSNEGLFDFLNVSGNMTMGGHRFTFGNGSSGNFQFFFDSVEDGIFSYEHPPGQFYFDQGVNIRDVLFHIGDGVVLGDIFLFMQTTTDTGLIVFNDLPSRFELSHGLVINNTLTTHEGNLTLNSSDGTVKVVNRFEIDPTGITIDDTRWGTNLDGGGNLGGRRVEGVPTYFTQRADGSVGSEDDLTDGEVFMRLAGESWDLGTTNYERIARIEFEPDGNHASGSLPSKITWETTPSGAITDREVMYLNSSGDLNLSVGSYFGDGSQLTGIVHSVNGTNINVLNIETTGINTTGNITLNNGVIISDNPETWGNSLKLKGENTQVGLNGNVSLEIDYSAVAFGPTLRGTSTRTGNNIIYVDGKIRFLDNQQMDFGTSNDVNILWDTTGDDYLSFRQVIDGGTARSGTFVFEDSLNLPTTRDVEVNPTVRIQSASTTASQYIKFNHNKTHGFITTGVGNIVLESNTKNVTLYSPDGSTWNCGVNDSGSFLCS